MLCFLLLTSCYRFYDFAMHSLYCSHRKPLLFSLILPRELSNRSLHPQRRTLVVVVVGCVVGSYPGVQSSQVPLCPTLCFRGHPCPSCVSPFKRNPRRWFFSVLFCFLRWTVRALGLQGTLKSAFCLQSRNSL